VVRESFSVAVASATASVGAAVTGSDVIALVGRSRSGGSGSAHSLLGPS